jgi:hypothetical protein
MWIILSYMSWAIAAALALWMLFDWFKIDTSYAEDILTSSREGELEAIAEKHKTN